MFSGLFGFQLSGVIPELNPNAVTVWVTLPLFGFRALSMLQIVYTPQGFGLQERRSEVPEVLELASDACRSCQPASFEGSRRSPNLPRPTPRCTPH